MKVFTGELSFSDNFSDPDKTYFTVDLELLA